MAERGASTEARDAPEVDPPVCTNPELGKLFQEYLSGVTLAPSELIAAQQHQVTCPRCQKVLEEFGRSKKTRGPSTETP